MTLNYQTAKWIMISLVALETLSVTYIYQNHPQLVSLLSIIYFMCGLGIAIIPIFHYPGTDSHPQPGKAEKIIARFVIPAFFITAVVYCVPALQHIFRRLPIDSTVADMLPMIQALSNRWLAGQEVYKPVMELWEGDIPNYLPMMWMPFVPLIWLGLEIRWTSVFFFFSAIGLLLWMLIKYVRATWVQLLIILVLLGNMIYIHTAYNNIFFAWTQEGVIIAFYILLGFGLLKNNPWVIGIAVACCLLSRYSLFFWVPAFMLFSLLTGEYKKAIKAAVVATVIMLIIFILPFFIKDPGFFFEIPNNYAHDNANAWAMRYDDLQSSFGFAKYFSANHLYLLHYFNIGTSVLVVLAFYSLLYFYRKRPSLNLAFAGICGLKLTLTFFYNFLEVPFFYYLFIMPTMFSFVVLLGFLRPARVVKSYVQ